jgi:colicin import membrane protein
VQEKAEPTIAEEQAMLSAQEYLDFAAFSRTGLIDQLSFEGFTQEQATVGVDSLHANWNKQAMLSAQEYLDNSSFSRTGLIDQLVFEGFTQKQATFGVNQTGL